MKFDLENHIEKTDYENQTIDFMLCLFTVDLKEFDHQCLLRFSVLCIQYSPTFFRSSSSYFKSISFRFDPIFQL